MGDAKDLEKLAVKFTPADHKILASYHSTAEAIAMFLGEYCEVSLHSLENPHKALVKIVNGRHTNREPGAALTEQGLEVLLEAREDPRRGFVCCTTSSSSGEPMRSIFVVLRNEEKAIGLLNISFNMAVSLAEFISTFSLYQGVGPCAATFPSKPRASTIEEMVEISLMEIVREVSDDPHIPNHEKNKNIVRRLDEKGVFDIKGAVRVVADHLKLSKFTVYSYLREYRVNGRDAAKE
ncbi:hypothetical protein CSA17_02020 [bacterium DOLJORAL78_65_58]|nr:MAG: hypothetical protein CSB20_11470 [bacterium DOLZORAL124_64_63]PIE76475.1 MAG: hypothetical protein CSA17_02020 [bacterium DOLJORAL78_65_58]